MEIEEVVHHCKAFLRSRLWDPATWDPDAAAPRAQIAQALERPGEPLADIERYYGPSYPDGLYRQA